jgi:beta-phosphoglucomutase-like phosphatase (HAD superfamily)
MRFDAIIFNFDGVIADSKRLSTQALIESMAEAGMPTSLDEALHDFSSKRWSDVLVLLEARMGSEIPESLISQQYKRMSRRVILEVGTVPGIEAFLDLTDGVPRAIAGSSEPIWISQTLARFGLEHHFGAHVYTTATLAHDKPDPEIYILAAEKLGIAPKRMVAIEDHVAGVMAAVAAGLSVIGFTAGSHILPGDAEAMKAAGAKMIADDFEDVADWIGWVS